MLERRGGFERAGVFRVMRIVREPAERGGYIVAAPMGYNEVRRVRSERALATMADDFAPLAADRHLTLLTRGNAMSRFTYVLPVKP